MVDSNKYEDCVNMLPFRKTDLVLVVEERELHVSRDILKSESPVFKSMFDSDFKEKSMDKIALDGKKYDDMVTFLNCLYPSRKEPVTRDNVLTVLPLADEYQTDLKIDCEDVIVCHMEEVLQTLDFSDTSLIIEYLLASELHSLPRGLESCFEVAARILSGKLEKVPKYESISIENKYEIMCRRDRLFEHIWGNGKGQKQWMELSSNDKFLSLL